MNINDALNSIKRAKQIDPLSPTPNAYAVLECIRCLHMMKPVHSKSETEAVTAEQLTGIVRSFYQVIEKPAFHFDTQAVIVAMVSACHPYRIDYQRRYTFYVNPEQLAVVNPDMWGEVGSIEYNVARFSRFVAHGLDVSDLTHPDKSVSKLTHAEKLAHMERLASDSIPFLLECRKSSV